MNNRLRQQLSAILFCTFAVAIGFSTPANAQIAFQCAVSAATVPTLRSEGLTELTGDIVLSCTGGTPTPAGQPVPQANLTVTLNTQVTSRLLNPLSSGSEALLLVDDPGGKASPNTPQTLCASLDGCAANGTGNGAIYDGASSHPNFFMGVVSGGSVVFNGVPIDPAPSGSSRVYRITNLRANANRLGTGTASSPKTIVASVTFARVSSGFTPPPVTPQSVTIGNARRGISFNVTNQQTEPNCIPLNNILLVSNPPPGDISSTLQFQAAFPGAFKPATVTGGVQNVPGTIYNSESGFILTADKGNNFTAGLADRGTRFKATFNNVPQGTSLFVSTSQIAGSTPGAAARLIGSETGPFSPVAPLGTSGVALVTLTNGSGIAIWEVTAADSTVAPVLNFSVYLAFQPPPNLNVNQPAVTVTANGGFSGPFVVAPGSGLPSVFSFVGDQDPRSLASGNLAVTNGNIQLPYFGGGITTSVAVTTLGTCQGAAQSLSVTLPSGQTSLNFTARPSTVKTAGGVTDYLLSDTARNAFSSPPSAPVSTGPSYLLADEDENEASFAYFFVVVFNLQTAVGIGGSNPFYPIAPGSFQTDGYRKQDFSYQVTPTATSDAKWLIVTPVNNGGTPVTFAATADPTGLAPGKYTGNISISALGQNSLTNTITATIPATLTVPAPGPSAPAAGFVSATTYQGSFAVPGMPLVIFGSAFGPSSLTGLSLTPDNSSITTSVADTRVLFDGNPAPMIYSANGQISTIVPFELAGKSSTQVVVEYKGVASPAVSLPVLDAAPGLFTANAQGTGQGAILNANSDGSTSFNSSSNPAPVGSTIVLYAAGAGQTNPPGKTGHLASAPFPTPVLSVTVFIDGKQAQVQYAGDAPGLFEGVLQVNAVIPAGTQPGNRTVVVKVGSTQTPPWATVAVSAAQ